MKARLLFTLVLLALAALHDKRTLGLDNFSVWLAVAAMVPWILPEIGSMISSLSVSGLFDVKFRELQEKVELQQNAIENGVGGKVSETAVKVAKAAAVATSLGGIPALEEDDGGSPVTATRDSSDPNKGQFGLQPSRDGFRLRATVNPFPGSTELFRIHAEVEGIDSGHRLGGGDSVRFTLPPTFPKPRVDVQPSGDGKSVLDRIARGAFTLGAEVIRAGKPPVRLELDLGRDVPGAPTAFREG
jgi:hypothetical protein